MSTKLDKNTYIQQPIFFLYKKIGKRERSDVLLVSGGEIGGGWIGRSSVSLVLPKKYNDSTHEKLYPPFYPSPPCSHAWVPSSEEGGRSFFDENHCATNKITLKLNTSQGTRLGWWVFLALDNLDYRSRFIIKNTSCMPPLLLLNPPPPPHASSSTSSSHYFSPLL